MFIWVHWWGVAKSNLLGAWDRTISPIILVSKRRPNASWGVQGPRTPQKRIRGCWDCHLWLAVLWGLDGKKSGRLFWMDEGQGGGGRKSPVCKTAVNTVLGAPSNVRPQSLLSGGDTVAFWWHTVTILKSLFWIRYLLWPLPQMGKGHFGEPDENGVV